MTKIINMSEYSKNKKARVRRQFNDHRIGETEKSNLEDPHWDTISGGVKAISPQPFIHAYVWCDDIDGDIAHSGVHGPCPHKIKVVILKKDNTKDVWNYIIEEAGDRPHYERAKPYRVDSDAKEVVNALINNKEHPAIFKRKSRDYGEIYVIYPRKISKLIETGTNNTILRRSKKFRQKIEELMKTNRKFELAYFSPNIAFRHIGNKSKKLNPTG